MTVPWCQHLRGPPPQDTGGQRALGKGPRQPGQRRRELRGKQRQQEPEAAAGGGLEKGLWWTKIKQLPRFTTPEDNLQLFHSLVMSRLSFALYLS